MKTPYKKRTREFDIAPRGPGLDFMQSDAEKVERAISHLTHLLADPYYHEACVRMRSEKHPALSGRRGRPPPLGELAANLQSGGDISEKIKHKEPHSLRVAKQIFAFEKDTGQTENRLGRCRDLVKNLNPDMSPGHVDQLAEKLSEKIANLRAC